MNLGIEVNLDGKLDYKGLDRLGEESLMLNGRRYELDVNMLNLNFTQSEFGILILWSAPIEFMDSGIPLCEMLTVICQPQGSSSRLSICICKVSHCRAVSLTRPWTASVIRLVHGGVTGLSSLCMCMCSVVCVKFGTPLKTRSIVGMSYGVHERWLKLLSLVKRFVFTSSTVLAW